MKKMLFLISLALNFVLYSQPSDTLKNYYYYFNNDRINLSINTQNFVVYFDLSKISKSNIYQNYNVLQEVQLSPSKSNLMCCCEVKINNNNYDSIVNYLETLSEVIDIESSIGDSNTVPVSNVFYIQLIDSLDYSLLVNLARITNTTIKSQVPECKNWYSLECTKNSVSNAIGLSNIFYESGLFANVDPGFVFKGVLGSDCVTDSEFESQWGMDRINACDAWNITTGNTNVKVAIIDLGIDEEHQEFEDLNIVDSYDALTNTLPADVYSYVVNANTIYHGSHVGGILFANHNNYEIAGISPNVSVINISYPIYTQINNQVAFENFASDMATSISRAVNNGADVINNSWFIGEIKEVNIYSQLLYSQIENALLNGRDGKGCVVVFCSGNSSNGVIATPADYHEDILVVGATKSNDEKWGMSQYGEGLDLVAPGVNIYSSNAYINGVHQYISTDGTSMAAPLVSGVAALILSVNPNLTGQQVREIIEQTAQKVGNYDYSNGGWNMFMGYGLLDAYRAVLMAKYYNCYNNENILTGEITENTTIYESTFGYDAITVTGGKTLTITSTLRLAPESRIIVRPGAKLIVNGGEIVGACGEYWDGIRVEGNKNLPQTETNQGVVELNNALISDAIDGISAIGENENWGKTGGIIKATNTTFKNNRRSIEFMSYGENTNTNSASYFRNCTFTWDDDLLPNASTSLSHITMYQVRGVEISGCTFKDERISTTGMTTHGILTDQSGFNVKEYLIMPGHNGGNLINKTTNFEKIFQIIILMPQVKI